VPSNESPIRGTIAIAPLRDDAEASACAALMVESEPWTTLGYTFNASLAAITQSTRECYIARSETMFCGFMVLNLVGPLPGYVQLLGVMPSMRGRSVGTALLDFAEQRILQEYPNVFLCVSSFNQGARNFYQRRGYRLVGELSDYLVTGHSELLLRKSHGPVIGYGNITAGQQPIR
jgi:ribosomal protein S18 acetylase RimI-like enzyme